MTTHFRIPCPGCGQPLKVRTQYLGQDVTCKHCERTFTAQAPPGEGPPATPGIREGLPLEDDGAAAARAGDRLRAEERERELADARTALSELRRQLDQAREQAEAASSLRAELDDTRKRLGAREAEVETRRTEAEAWEHVRAERDRLQLELAASRSEVEARTAELGALTGSLEANRHERDRLAAEVDGLRVELKSREGEATRLTEVEAGRDALQSERERLADELRAARSELETALERERKAEERAEGLRLQLEERDRSASESVSQLEKERDSLAKALAANEAALRDHSEQRTRAEAEVQRLSAECDSMAGKLDSAEMDAQTLQFSLESLRIECDDASERLAELERERDELGERLSEAQRAHRLEVERLVTALEEWEKRAGEARLEAEGLEERLRALKEELDAVRKSADVERARAARDAGAALERHDRELAAARDESAGRTERGHHLEVEARSVAGPAPRAQEGQESSQLRVVELEANLAESQRALEQLRSFLSNMGIHIHARAGPSR